jgi:toxin ParE1/3/4
MNVDITASAEADLAEISEFIAQDNPARAESFVAGLFDVCEKLQTMGLRWPFIPGYKDYGLRRASYRGYTIVYRVDGDTAFVLRVLHTSRDLPPIFEKLKGDA